MIDPLSNDPFSNPAKPTNSRFGAQFRGLFDAVQGQAAEQAKGWAASNPDKLESIGERVGQAAAMGLGGGIIGRKAGKKLGGKLGRMASNKAQGSIPLPPEAPGSQDIPF